MSSTPYPEFVSAMDTRDLNRLLEGHPVTARFYDGTYPCDQLPCPKTFLSAMVSNLDDSSLPGSHWVALFVQNANKVYYFDPFGEAPPPGPMSDYLRGFGNVTRNRCVFQPFDSTVCGAFAVYTLFHLCLGKSFEQVMSQLYRSSDPDGLVRSFVNSCLR